MATLLVAVRSMNQKATQRFGASPRSFQIFVEGIIELLLSFSCGLGSIFGGQHKITDEQIARRNAEKREQYEMDRKASVEDTLKGHCRMREYYHRRIERLRSRIAALEEQDVATSSPVAAMENQESTRCFLSMWMLEALDRPEVGYQCLEIML
ncbi:uncharacterized protein [Coffea arabica]|uniref:Uncharacterized protein isoform X6 n=1 Tax=Coffea arabica TaxID=13443 RepID=A0ABM4W095_COFAR